MKNALCMLIADISNVSYISLQAIAWSKSTEEMHEFAFAKFDVKKCNCKIRYFNTNLNRLRRISIAAM